MALSAKSASCSYQFGRNPPPTTPESKQIKVRLQTRGLTLPTGFLWINAGFYFKPSRAIRELFGSMFGSVLHFLNQAVVAIRWPTGRRALKSGAATASVGWKGIVFRPAQCYAESCARWVTRATVRRACPSGEEACTYTALKKVLRCRKRRSGEGFFVCVRRHLAILIWLDDLKTQRRNIK